jgi:hypothetical protein
MFATSYEGERIHLELHSTDAHAGVVVTMYNSGSQTVRTLAAGEYIEVHSFIMVSAAGGDTEIFFSTSATPPAGGTIYRGTLAASGGIALSQFPAVGDAGMSVWAISPAGAFDAVGEGCIRRGGAQPLIGRQQPYVANNNSTAN